MSEEARRLLLTRHPETEANVARRYLGQSESPYSERGKRQVEDLVHSIAEWMPDLVLSSPRERATGAAEKAAALAGVPFEVDADLDELDFGKAEGLTYDEAWAAEIAGTGPMDPASAPFEDAETWGHWGERMLRASRRLLEGPPAVAVVAHAGTVRGLLAELMEVPMESAWHFRVRNASLCVVTYKDRFVTLEAFGLTAGRCPWQSDAPPGLPPASP